MQDDTLARSRALRAAGARSRARANAAAITVRWVVEQAREACRTGQRRLFEELRSPRTGVAQPAWFQDRPAQGRPPPAD